LLLAGLPTSKARADWLFTPFIGTTFGTETGFLDLDVGAAASRHWMFGGNVGWLSDNVFGVEADLGFVPGFFQSETFNLITSSRVTTLFGNVIAAVPITVSRESLRPYILGGLGLVHVSVQEPVGLFIQTDNSLGLQLGGGALGFITNRTGVRFDLRNVRSLERTTDVITLERESKLSFWRATIGVTIRY
jgi:hypothetical protein